MTPSFNDKMFEVMAVFGTTHLALSMAEKATRVNAISNHAMQCHRTRVVQVFTNHGLTDRSFKTGSVLWSVIFLPLENDCRFNPKPQDSTMFLSSCNNIGGGINSNSS